jgi:hypothetical protein
MGMREGSELGDSVVNDTPSEVASIMMVGTSMAAVARMVSKLPSFQYFFERCGVMLV